MLPQVSSVSCLLGHIFLPFACFYPPRLIASVSSNSRARLPSGSSDSKPPACNRTTTQDVKPADPVSDIPSLSQRKTSRPQQNQQQGDSSKHVQRPTALLGFCHPKVSSASSARLKKKAWQEVNSAALNRLRGSSERGRHGKIENFDDARSLQCSRFCAKCDA